MAQRPAARARFALMIAHPGHELRAYGWLSRSRPMTYVLTDGSGGDGISRLRFTEELLDQCDARPGEVFGRLTDRALYSSILLGDRRLFEDLVDELAGSLARHGVECVVGDSAEGYNPGHDICRGLIDAAVARLNRVGKSIGNFAFPLIGAADAPPPFCRRPGLGLMLEPELLDRKLAAARAYAPLQREVESEISEHGEQSLLREFLFPSSRSFGGDWPRDEPLYERFGAEQVAAGRYDRVIRYREHVRPLVAAMHAHAARSRIWAASAS